MASKLRLYVLHNELHLDGARFGSGLTQRGDCSVLLDTASMAKGGK